MRLIRSFDFEAAHRLDWHLGKCKRLHGHNYHFEVIIEGPLNSNGVVMDFDELKEIVKKTVITKYDHQFLNDFLDNPTAELLAQDIFDMLKEQNLPMYSIRLWETPQASVEVLASS